MVGSGRKRNCISPHLQQIAGGTHAEYRVRREAGIEDVRLHDLRHAVASYATLNGVPLPVVSHLLGETCTRSSN